MRMTGPATKNRLFGHCEAYDVPACFASTKGDAKRPQRAFCGREAYGCAINLCPRASQKNEPFNMDGLQISCILFTRSHVLATVVKL